MGSVRRDTMSAFCFLAPDDGLAAAPAAADGEAAGLGEAMGNAAFGLFFTSTLVLPNTAHHTAHAKSGCN